MASASVTASASAASSDDTTMSITQALARLKLMRKRIDNTIDEAEFIKMRTKKSSFDIEEFSRHAKGSYQSFNDLVKMYNKMKAAIVVSNATTTVNIGGKVYTVAEAVERKRSIEFEKRLLDMMKMQYNEVKRSYEAHQASELARVERLLSVELGKDAKTNPDTIKVLSDSFLAENKATIVDPLHLETLIKSTTEEIEMFETTVDYTLSESNGRTMISF
jgi:hypothetical protein